MEKAVNKLWFNLSLHFTMLEKILESKEMHNNGLLDAQKHLISSTRCFAVLSNRCSFVMNKDHFPFNSPQRGSPPV